MSQQDVDYWHSPAGKALEQLIKNKRLSLYEDAESDADHSRDYIQRARGIKDCLDIIHAQATMPVKGKQDRLSATD